MLEELKLTKESAGDSGQALSQLQKSLKIAQENVIKSDDKVRELNGTLETRTANFLKEKGDLKKALDKALADLKNSSSNSSGVLQENEDLKNKLEETRKKLTDTESELEILRD